MHHIAKFQEQIWVDRFRGGIVKAKLLAIRSLRKPTEVRIPLRVLDWNWNLKRTENLSLGKKNFFPAPLFLSRSFILALLKLQYQSRNHQIGGMKALGAEKNPKKCDRIRVKMTERECKSRVNKIIGQCWIRSLVNVELDQWSIDHYSMQWLG